MGLGDNSLISEEDLSRVLGRIRDVLESSMKDGRPSFFEVYTILAYMYFKEKNLDFAVYEVGLGGRLDATNIVEPLVCAITPLSYEHTDKLGNTLEEIAFEKCGIIKDNTPCVSAPQDKEALKTIEKICKDRNSSLVTIGKDIVFDEVRSNDTEEVFNVSAPSGEHPLLMSSLIGSHQIVNAAVAIGVVEALKLRGIAIPADTVRKGIERARWEGRLEIINRKPYLVLDGAQNKASAHALASAIKKIFKFKKLILVLGVSKDKDVSGMLEELMPVCDSLVLTKSKVLSRALEPEKIKNILYKIKHGIKDITLTSSIGDALNKALSKAGPDDLILVTGSLFVVGEVKENYSGCLKTA